VVIADPNASTTTIAMVDDATVTAHYVTAQYNLTVVNGTLTGGLTTGTFPYDTDVSILANPAQPGQIFARWIGDAATVGNYIMADTTIDMTGADYDIVIEANYLADDKYYLDVVSGSGSGEYDLGEVVNIQADLNLVPTGYEFFKWKGDVHTVDDRFAPNTTIFMGTDVRYLSIEPKYKRLKYNLNVIGGVGSGDYEYGDLAGIAADPGPLGFHFLEWTSTHIANVEHPTEIGTFVTIPHGNMTVTATYEADVGDLDDASVTKPKSISHKVSTNHAPRLVVKRKFTGTAGKELRIEGIVAKDRDGNYLKVQAEDLPGDAELIEVESEPGKVEYELEWKRPQADTYKVKLTAKDVYNATDDKIITIRIKQPKRK